MPRRAPAAFLSACAAVLIAGTRAPAGEAEGRPRPNIVIILADDLGFSDIGCYGSEIPTPNLDRLAARGLRFTRFYNTARCCPTRAALLTGLYPHQAGVGHMVSDRGSPAYRGRLGENTATIAEVLGKAGYRTLMSGKWHVGEKRPHWPVDRGFHRYLGLISGASSYFEIDPGRTFASGGAEHRPAEPGFYMTDAITESAVGFLDEHAAIRPDAASGGRPPFFLYVAYTAPHWPLHARPEDLERHRATYLAGWDEIRAARHRKMLSLGIADRRWMPSPRPRGVPPWADVRAKDEKALRMAAYAAQIDRMDQGIGRILERIEKMGALDDTLVFFLSDNGGSFEVIDRGGRGGPAGSPESFLSYGPEWAHVSNTPFRIGKARVHEGGIASPFIVAWPSRVRAAGAIRHEPGHVIDIAATCFDAAGVEPPRVFGGREVVPIEGKSLLPLFDGRAREGHEALYWEHQGNRAVRKGRWKLVALHGKPWELYDIEEDRTELHDLARDRPEIVSELAALYDRWAERCGVLPWRRRARI